MPTNHPRQICMSLAFSQMTLSCRDPTYSVARAMAAPILHVKDACPASVKGSLPEKTDTSEVQNGQRDDDLASTDSLGTDSSSGLDSPREGHHRGSLSCKAVCSLNVSCQPFLGFAFCYVTTPNRLCIPSAMPQLYPRCHATSPQRCFAGTDDETSTSGRAFPESQARPTAKLLPRGDVLILGGDLAYPNPSTETYELRFFAPFEAALPPPPVSTISFCRLTSISSHEDTSTSANLQCLAFESEGFRGWQS